ncbi:hypothetical protein [Paraliomyxa miuraensis]|uniref:hypothetical protein n=1 Tax=Paraliomyxa miuraensis TaxID=376150 RepID=UPI002259DC63|nr:hypothetical protein [Paraliomyxa miuraensis]MCX4242677.1 hypothetical protein [Paraliomyxa miuraensis]
MVSVRSTLALALGALGALASPSALAAPDGSDTNRYRAHLGADLGSWVRQTPWPRTADGPTGSRDDFGFIGLRRLQLHGGLGHGFRDRFVAGLRLDYEISRGIQRSLDPDAEARAITVGAMPYLTVMFDDKNTVRPYLSMRAGLGAGLLTIVDPSPLDRPERSSSLLFPVMGVDLGAHAFVAPHVSLDGMVSVEHRWEYLRGTTPSTVPEGADQLRADAGHVSFNRRFVTSIGLAVSRWF